MCLLYRHLKIVKYMTSFAYGCHEYELKLNQQLSREGKRLMIIKKKKAVVAAILSAAMTVSAIMPAVSAAGTRTKPEKYGDGTYAQRFLSLYDDVITNGNTNGYLSDANAPAGGFGVPYHCVETLNIEAPDYGHETTSEAMSYIVWMAAMRDNIGNKAAKGDLKDENGNAINASNEGDLAKAWKTMEVMIPKFQEGFMGHADLSAQYSQEHDQPEEYPTPQDSQNTGKNPLASVFSNTYRNDGGLYLMHWLADVDDWYGYGADTSYSGANGPGKLVFINTFQRGAQESCWETVPHACVETLKWGQVGRGGVKAVFSAQGQEPPASWSYTNAPDAEDRAIQGAYAAARWGVGDSNVLSLAGKMGDQLRNNMFDKYYKPIGTQNEKTPQDTGNPYSGAHYLMSWYTSWGGANDGAWAWQIGASHCHEFYQNPLAAYALLNNKDMRAGMKSGQQAVTDYEKSLQTQLEFYLWLQSEDGPIAGGATSSWHGRYLPYKYLADADAEYIAKYGTDIPTEFNKMAYQEHPVYADPGSNHWIGNQVWAVQRLAELYYDIKTNPSETSAKIKVGGLSMEDALAKILDRWVAWFLDEEKSQTKLIGEDDYQIPASLDWFGQPETWKGAYNEKNGVTCTVTAVGSSDLGCVSSLCNSLIYYAKANGVKTEAAYSSNNTDNPSKALHLAHELLDREWRTARDNIGLSRTEHNGSMWRLFEQEVWVPTWINGTMPNGDPLKNGATFLSIRSQYKTDAKVQEFEKVYNEAKAKGYEGGSEGMTEALESVDLNYHRFWHAGDIMLALGTMADLYPDMEVDKSSEDKPDEKDLVIENEEITVEVDKTETIKTNRDDATFKSNDESVATVDADGKVTGKGEGKTTITVTTPDGKTGTVTVTVTPAGEDIPTGSLDPNEDYLYGDVDLDGAAAAVNDLVLLSKFIANKTKYDLFPEDAKKHNKSLVQANVEYDEAVDTADLLKLVEANLKKIDLKDLGPQK
jgi:hypothetical protein